MPRYSYIAIDTVGKKAKGAVAAESAYAARKQLRMRGMHPTDVQEIGVAAEEHHKLALSFRRRNKKQVIEFTKQLSVLLGSGIKLTEALSVLTLQVSSGRLHNAIVDIRDRVVTGESFTDAMRDYDDLFDIVYISMVKVGEMTGSIEKSFATIASFMEKRQKVEQKLMTAMMYPMILIFFCFAAVLVLTTKAIPKIGEQIKATGKELPWITQKLMDFGHVMTNGWAFVVIGVIAALIYAVKKFVSTDRGAFLRDKMLLSLPVFGPLVKQRVVARFASTLSTLLGSGLPMAESLKVVAEVTGNRLMRQAVGQARDRIMAGADISTPLRESGVIDPAIAHMVSVGEKTGELERMLQNISENLEASADVVIERLSAAVEPLIIVVMAAVIGVIAYATLLPILEISNF